MRSALSVCLVVWGCACATPPPPRPVGPPLSAEVVRLEVKDQTLTDFTAVASVKVSNPGPEPVTVTDAEVVLVMDEKEVAKRVLKLGQAVPAGGEATVDLSAEGTYAKDGAEVEALGDKKSLDFALKGDLAVQRPGGKEEFLEWARAGLVRTPRMPVARMYTVQATRSDRQIDLVFLVELSNPNPFDLKIGAVKTQIALNDRPVGEHGTTGGTVPGGGGSQYSVPLSVTPAVFGKDLIQLAKQNRIRYRMTGAMDLGLVQVPVDLSGGVPFSQ